MPEFSALVTDIDAWVVLVLLCVSFFGTLLFIPWAVVRIPADYFHQRRRRTVAWPRLHPVLRIFLLLLKNLAGLALLTMGIAMLVLPGQGLLTMLIGLLLIDFPGKFAAERWLVQRGPILRSINWLRQRRGRDPLDL